MYIFYMRTKLQKRIELNKYGITIRKMTSKEKNIIMNDIIILKSKEKDVKNFCLENKDLDILSLDFINKLCEVKDEITITYNIMAFGLLKRDFIFNDFETISKIVDNLIVVEIEKEILDNYVIGDVKHFISNLLCLFFVYDDALIKDNKYINDYTKIMDDIVLSKKNNEYLNWLILNIMMQNKNGLRKIAFECVINNNYLLRLRDFVDYLNKDELFKFVELLDLYFSKSDVIQNKLLSNVTVVESLLVKENEDIAKAYILKGGLVLKKYLDKSSNKAIQSLLSFTYNIRSDIIHGNYTRIIDDYNKLSQKENSVKQMIGDFKNNKDKRIKIIEAAANVSVILSRCVVKLWIDDPSYIDFLKNN